MPLLNVNLKDSEKEKIKKHIKGSTDKSMSEYVRSILSEKMKIDEIINNVPNETPITIPEYVPKNKYVVFVNGAVVAVGDSPCDLAEIAVKKFPQYPFNIKYNGKIKRRIEYVYMSFKEFNGWKYSIFEENTYPIIPITLYLGKGKMEILAIFDTAATLCVLKDNVINVNDQVISRKEQLFTAGGIVDASIYNGSVSILDSTFDIEFTVAPISDLLPFKFLIGRNLMDQLDAYFMGKKQILLLKEAEL